MDADWIIAAFIVSDTVPGRLEHHRHTLTLPVVKVGATLVVARGWAGTRPVPTGAGLAQQTSMHPAPPTAESHWLPHGSALPAPPVATPGAPDPGSHAPQAV